MLQTRQRARRAGTRPRTDHTIENGPGHVRDLALFLAAPRQADWALVDVHDVEAFLAALPKSRKRRLTVLRQFFRFARTHKIVLADPTRGLAGEAPRGFTGPTLPLDQQRDLFRRWTTDTAAIRTRRCWASSPCCTAPPAAKSGCCAATTSTRRTAPSGSAGDPSRSRWTRPAGQCCSGAWRIGSPAHREPPRRGHPRHEGPQAPGVHGLLHPPAGPGGVPPQIVRCTRLAALVNTIDPKLVAAAFGLNHQGVMFYLADRVDDAHLAGARSNP